MAATIAELRRYTLARDFRHIDPREATVMLLEGGPRILPSYPEELSAVAKAKLRGLGVEVRENMLVSNIERGCVEAAGWTIPTHTVVWAAGMRGSPLLKTLDTPLDRMGRAIVEPDCTIPGTSRGIRHRRCGALRGSGAGHPPRRGTRPRSRWAATSPASSPATCGESRARRSSTSTRASSPSSAVARQSPRSGSSSSPASLPGFIWAFVHIAFLIGFRNRILVMLQWAWSYFNYERGARLITGTEEFPVQTAEREVRG